jgi:predicted ATPase/class 3 adenylate cyclase
MRARLADVAHIDAPGGRVRLRMSVGVHTGEFLLFLVGQSHRELVITGPAASTTVMMEHDADAGDILVSPTVADHLPAQCLGGRKGPGVLLRRAPGTISDAVAVALPPRDCDLTLGIPIGLRAHLLEGASEPEHRIATVAFVHFDEVDELVAEQGPAALGIALDELVTVAADAASEHGVTFLASDVDHDGGKIILTAAVPLATGHDEERMLQTVRRISTTNTQLPLRIGVNRGHVFAGEVGPHYRRTYTVMGDTVNLAARVMAAAKPGQVLCTGGVLEQSHSRFETEALPPFMVKGKSKPVQAYVLGEPVRRRAAIDDTATPLVGRAPELAELRTTIARARQGHGRVVQIRGEAGAGKTRLLHEVALEASDFVRVLVSCVPYETASAYRTLREILVQLIGGEGDAADLEARLRVIVENEAPELARYLPLLAAPLQIDIPDTEATASLDERFRKQQTDRVSAQLLGALLRAPTLVVLEDVQWMDDASVDVMRIVELGVTGGPWLVCVTRNDDPTGFRTSSDDVLDLELAPLDDDAATELVGVLTDGHPLRPHELQLLVQRAGGNPRFLVELTNEVMAAGATEHLPDSVDGLVSAQLDRLPVDARRELRTASVLGLSFDADVLTLLLDGTNGDPSPAPTSALKLHQLDMDRFDGLLVLDHAGRVHFRHALLRDVAYQSLPYRQRTTLHQRAGAVLERTVARPDEHAAVLSLHFYNGEDYGAAWRYARLAGDRARDTYANVEAEELLTRALAAARRLDLDAAEVAATAEALGDVRDRIGVYDGARLAYRTARGTGRDSLATARLCLKEAWMAERLGIYPQALRWIRRGERAIEDLEPSPEVDAACAQLAVGHAVVRYAQGRARDAKRSCERAIALARAVGDRSVLAHALYLLDWANVAMGHMELAVHSAEALKLYQDLGDLSGEAVVANNLGALAYFEGRWTDAVELYEHSRAARMRTGDAVEAATATTNIAEILIERDQLDDAERLLRDARRVYQAAPYLAGVAYATAHLGRVAARAGRPDDASALLDEARALYASIGGRETLEVDAMRAEARVLAGDAPGALAIADEALTQARAKHELGLLGPSLLRSRAYALGLLGRFEDAETALVEGLALAREQGVEYDAALTEIAGARIDAWAGQPARTTDDAAEVLARLGVADAPRVVAAVSVG